MSFTIGRCAMNGPITAISISGAAVSITCDIETVAANDANEMKARRQQLLGLIDNTDEPVVPFTWSEDSSLDGFYRVTSVQVPSLDLMLVNGFIADVQIQMDQIMSFSNAACEVTTLSTVRTNAHTITAPIGIIGVLIPSTFQEYNTSSIAVAGPNVSRTTDAGAALGCIIATAPSALNWYRSAVPPSLHYTGGCLIEVKYGSTWYPVVGTRIPVNSVWRISNGLVRLTSANGATSGTLERSNGGAWAGTAISVSHVTNGAVGPGIGQGNGTAQGTLTIRRNSPEQVVVKVGAPDLEFTYSIQRGAMLVESSWTTRNAAKYGIGYTTTNACTAISTWGIRRTSNDTNSDRLVFGMPVLITSDVTNGRINAATPATSGQMFAGVELAGSAAITGNTNTDLRDQFFGAPSWSQRVVPR